MTVPPLFADDNVAVVERLAHKYGAKVALDGVTLTIPRGSVFGLLGENGAGKTTFIKHLLGLLRPRHGSVSVFGFDPVHRPVEVLGRIGYLSEENDLPGWMRVDELMCYTRGFYPRWDPAYAEELRSMFGLEPTRRIKDLSKGQRARAGLLTALAHRPEFLILDEPSSGLDPIVRRDIVEAIIHTIADDGRTVLFSSHLLDEVERVSDHVAMLHQGRVVFCLEMDEIKENHHCLRLRFDEDLRSPPSWDPVLSWTGCGRDWTAICRGDFGALQAESAQLGAAIVDRRGLSLDELFVAQAGRHNLETHS